MYLINKIIFFKFTILTVKYDGLHDYYYLFDKVLIFKTENNRDFWNDFE